MSSVSSAVWSRQTVAHDSHERERPFAEREAMRQLLVEAEEAAREGVRVVERLKTATEQYRERLDGRTKNAQRG